MKLTRCVAVGVGVLLAGSGAALANGNGNGNGDGNGDLYLDGDAVQPAPVEQEPVEAPAQREPVQIQQVEIEQPQMEQEMETPVVTEEPEERELPSQIGVAISLGGGVTNFFSSNTRDQTNVGGQWDVRALIGSRYFAGLELAYVGTAQDIDAVGLDPDATLVGNGGEAALRLQLPFEFGVGNEYALTPFVLGGIGWRYYSLVNEDFNTSNVSDNDTIGTIPLGAGLAFGYRGLLVDARFTYRPTFSEDLFINQEGENADLQNWAVGLTLGYEF